MGYLVDEIAVLQSFRALVSNLILAFSVAGTSSYEQSKIHNGELVSEKTNRTFNAQISVSTRRCAPMEGSQGAKVPRIKKKLEDSGTSRRHLTRGVQKIQPALEPIPYF